MKYQTICLFLGDGSNRKNIKKLTSEEVIEVLGIETFRDNGNEWVIGMIKAHG